MKKFFKTIGICIGLPFLNLLVANIAQVIFFKCTGNNLQLLKNNAYIIAFLADIITLILMYIVFLPTNEGLCHRIKLKKIEAKDYFYISILGIGVTILLLFLTGILTLLIPSYKETVKLMATARQSILQLIITIILIPIYEEIFYRGIIFGYLRKNFNIIIAIILQAFIFGFMHMNLVQGIYAFIFGVVLALVYIYTESIIGNILLHMIFNLLGILIIPNLVMKMPALSIVLLILGVICTIYSIRKMVYKSKKA